MKWHFLPSSAGLKVCAHKLTLQTLVLCLPGFSWLYQLHIWAEGPRPEGRSQDALSLWGGWVTGRGCSISMELHYYYLLIAGEVR